MSRTLTIRLTPEQDDWLEAASRQTGLAQGRLVREQMDRARQTSKQRFLRLVGMASGPHDLSTGKGFSTKRSESRRDLLAPALELHECLGKLPIRHRQ